MPFYEAGEAGMTGMTGDTKLSDGVVTLRMWRPSDASAVFAACQDP